MKFFQGILALAGCGATAFAQLVIKPQNAATQYSQIVTTPLNITSLYNNRAFGNAPGDADFDGSGNCYPAQYLPSANLSYDGFAYNFPQYKTSGYDNLISQSQNISVDKGRYFSIQMLAAGEDASASGYVTAHYADGTTSSGQVLVAAWYTWPYPAGGDLIFPYYYDNVSVNWNRSNIFQTANWLDTSKELISLSLPASDSSNRLHIFAISLWPAPEQNSSKTQLAVQYARSTQKWIENTNKTQIFEVTVSNVGHEAWVLANDSVTVSIESDGVTTVSPGIIKRLQPGDQVIVEVGVINKAGISAGTTGKASARLTSSSVNVTHSFEATFGIGTYDANYASIYSHESPDWYNNAKYGIFIHWGVYSVPGWGNTGSNESYAEWYWYDMNEGPDTSVRTWEYHLKTYGPNVVYDDFISNFTAEYFTPKDWVDLFADAGATYFVQVSKHHEGYALFDVPSDVTNRTSVALFPHRNLLQELFDAAIQYQPQLHRATYFSLPEWFNPAYQKYGFGDWPGGNATNPYTNVTLPYTGYVEVDDFITGIQVPQMQILADMGTEIMWCDIGGPNMTTEFAAAWFNKAIEQNRQVVMNSRCGLPGDFDTPEYATYGAIQSRKWESNLGMDPYSYGYNRATPDYEYMNASTLVTSLIDTVSKNGNFLLDIGPMANGTVVETEALHLREAGKWIKAHAEAIFNTTYWFVTPEEGDDVRFTTTPDAFYILVMNQVNTTLQLSSPIPWIPTDEVTVVGGNMSGSAVPVQTVVNSTTTLYEFTISEAIQKADQWAWVFKITY